MNDERFVKTFYYGMDGCFYGAGPFDADFRHFQENERKKETEFWYFFGSGEKQTIHVAAIDSNRKPYDWKLCLYVELDEEVEETFNKEISSIKHWFGYSEKHLPEMFSDLSEMATENANRRREENNSDNEE